MISAKLFCAGEKFSMRVVNWCRYVRLGPVAAVKRLTQLHEHGLANQICEYLDLSPNDVLMHWACAKVWGSHYWMLWQVSICIHVKCLRVHSL
jgi:hypothetical protein